MASTSNVRAIIAWFEALVRGKNTDFEKELNQAKIKFNKNIQLIRDKSWRNKFNTIVERFESASGFQDEKPIITERQAQRNLVDFPTKAISKQHGGRVFLTNIRPVKTTKETHSNSAVHKNCIHTKTSRFNEEYACSFAKSGDLNVFVIVSKDARDKIDCLQQGSKCLAESFDFLEDGDNHLREAFQKQLQFLNLEMNKQDEMAVRKTQEIQSYRQIVHNPILLAAHLLYNVIYKPRNQEKLL